MSRRMTPRDGVAEVMAVGLDPDPEGIDTPLDDAAADATEPEATEELSPVIEKPEDGEGGAAAAERDGASDRGAVGRLVAELLADPALGYEAIVEQVRGRFPTAATSVRSVASTASILRQKGVEVTLRRRAKR